MAKPKTKNISNNNLKGIYDFIENLEVKMNLLETKFEDLRVTYKVTFRRKIINEYSYIKDCIDNFTED